MTAAVVRERWRGEEQRKARILRLVVGGKGWHAQQLLEAAAAEDVSSTYTREPNRKNEETKQ